jgi:hypothetical protein
MTEQQWVIYRARDMDEVRPDGTIWCHQDPWPVLVCRVSGTQEEATAEVRKRNLANRDYRHHYGCMLAEYWGER